MWYDGHGSERKEDSMAADDEQARRKRRSHDYGFDPRPIVNSIDEENSPQDDNYYYLDEGLGDTNRPNTSAVRWNNPTGSYTTRTTGEQSPISARRSRTTTNNLARSQTSSRERNTTSSLQKRPIQPNPSSRQTTGSLGKRLPSSETQKRNTDPDFGNVRQTRRTSVPLDPHPQYKKANDRKQAEENETHKIHWLVPAGVGMFAMLVLFILGSSILSWATQQYNNIEYGMPRTYQTDAVVGHGGDSTTHPSHFIAMNLNHQAIVIEMMASNPAKSVTYVVANIVGDNSSLAPVTLQFRDVNNDKKPDMIVYVHLNGQEQVSVFINEGTKFRPANSTDKIKY
jgi:hypothetical protein